MSATKTPAKKPATKTAAKKPAKGKDALHYDKASLLEEYSGTYSAMMLVTGGFVLFVVLYFMVFIIYLGGFSHSPHQPFVDHFSDRIDFGLEYKGQPLPVYEQQQ